MTSVTIPNSIDTLAGTFSGCTGLKSVNIPNSVTIIDGAFSGCTGLKSITIPNSVTIIGHDTFYHCTGLKSINIPNSVTSIGESAFEECTSLKSIVIPKSVTSIGNNAFLKCTNLASVDIQNPELCSSIDYEKVFKDSKALQPKSNQNVNKSRTAAFNSKESVMAYLYGHTFKSSDGTSIKFKSFAFYYNGSEAQASYNVKRYDSKTALVEVKSGIYNIVVYVYGAEGHIVQDNKMYFAQ